MVKLKIHVFAYKFLTQDCYCGWQGSKEAKGTIKKNGTQRAAILSFFRENTNLVTFTNTWLNIKVFLQNIRKFALASDFCSFLWVSWFYIISLWNIHGLAKTTGHAKFLLKVPYSILYYLDFKDEKKVDTYIQRGAEPGLQ